MDENELKEALHQAMISYNTFGNPEESFGKGFAGRLPYGPAFLLTYALAQQDIPQFEKKQLSDIFIETIRQYVPELERYMGPSQYISVEFPSDSPFPRYNDKISFSAPYLLIKAYAEEVKIEAAKETLRSTQNTQEKLIAGATMMTILEDRLNLPYSDSTSNIREIIEGYPLRDSNDRTQWLSDKHDSIARVMENAQYPTITALVGMTALIQNDARQGKAVGEGDLGIPEQLKLVLTDKNATSCLEEELRLLDNRGAYFGTSSFATKEQLKQTLNAIGNALKERAL